MSLTDRLVSDAVLAAAYRWLCRQRGHWPDGADVWSFRRSWLEEKARLRAELLSGIFRFGLLERTEKKDSSEIESFPARSARTFGAGWAASTRRGDQPDRQER